MKFIGIGDNVADRYINQRIMYPGGNAVNFSVFAKECGEDSAYLGIIADDREGRMIKKALEKKNVDTTFSPLVKGCATERCDVELIEGDRHFVGSGYGPGEKKSFTLSESHLEYLKNFDAIHCGCYSEMEDEIVKLDDIPGLKTFDFSEEEEYREYSFLQKILPFIDIALFSGASMDAEEEKELWQKVLRFGTGHMLVTRGILGQRFFCRSGSYRGIVRETEPLDTMGAGDSFFAAFLVSLMRSGLKRDIDPDEAIIEEAFRKAADFSAENCKRRGSFGFGERY